MANYICSIRSIKGKSLVTIFSVNLFTGTSIKGSIQLCLNNTVYAEHLAVTLIWRFGDID